MNRPFQPRARGFTLIEIIIVIALVAIAAAISVPYLLAPNPRRTVSRQARLFVSDMARIRTMAAKGRRFEDWPEGRRMTRTGVQFIGGGAYQIFLQDDSEPPVRTTIERVDLQERVPKFTLLVTSDQSVLLFKRNGTLSNPNGATVTITEEDSGAAETINISYGGLAKIAH